MKNAYEPSNEEIQALVDGELSPEAAARVRSAMVYSPRAIAELDECLQMAALAHALREEAAAPSLMAKGSGVIPLPSHPPWIRQSTIVALAASFAVAAGVLMMPVRHGGPDVRAADPSEVFASALAPRRAIEPRLSWPAADRHRPYDTARASGGEHSSEKLSFELLAKVETLRDPRAMTAAEVLVGNTDQATHGLTSVHRSPDANSDRAAIALVEGKPEDALLAAAAALARDPHHAQAAWNRALALERLGLPVTASEAFAAIASRGEPGWSREAAERGDALRTKFERRQADWTAVNAACAKLVATGQVDAATAAAHPDRVRYYFYEAVRTAPSAERVRALRPLAELLDAHFGGSHLTFYIQRIARSDFRRRGPLAARYTLLTHHELSDRTQVGTLIDALRTARQNDILLGALLQGGAAIGQVDEPRLNEFVALARATGDPWLERFADEQRGLVALGKDELSVAHSLLNSAASVCEGGGTDYPCQRIFRLLTHVYVALHRPEEARRSLDSARRLARATGSLAAENELLWYSHLVVALRDDISASLLPLSEAYLDEKSRLGTDCAAAHLERESIAMLLINQDRFDDARRQLTAAAGACKAPFTSHRAFVLANLLSGGGDGAEVQALRDDIAARRGSPAVRPGERAFLDHIEGQLLVQRAPAEGRALLRRAIAAAAALPGDIDAVRARSYSYAALVEDAAKRDASGEALDLLAEERGLPAPARCALGASLERSAVFVARGADATAISVRVLGAPGIPAGAARVPDAIRTALSGCESVDVFAQQPYYGRPDLLPREMAWQFRTGAPAQEPAAAPGRQIVVANIPLPAGLDLAPLLPVRAAPGAILIEGPAATPEHVMTAASDASYLEIHAHGLLGGNETDTSLLVLAADAGGRYALGGDDIRQARLRGAPVVVLAACHASAIGGAAHSTWGLADAFAEAGARAIIASPDAIQDAGAAALFAALRDRIAGGQAPAVALRDERLAHTDPAERAWIDRLVVFR